ncbi:MAG: ThuA domain-containing protein, partial [Vicinamibacteraceae bacterium]
GPDGALYVVDFYNQAVIHNDTRGPMHGPANAALRPDRDHYFGRIWRVQHKQAKTLEVPVLDRTDLDALIRVIETGPNAHVKRQAWRLVRENHGSDPRVAKLQRPMGSKALRLYERARTARTPERRRAQLDAFAQARDNWSRSAIVAAATDDASAFVAEALSYGQPEALTDFVTAVLPSALPDHAGELLALAANAPAGAAPLKLAVVDAVGRMEDGPIDGPADDPADGSVTLDATTTQALQKLLEDPVTSAATLPVIAKWDKAGTLAASADSRARAMLRELRTAETDDERRADLVEGLLALPKLRSDVLSVVAPMLGEPAVSESLKGRLLATLGDTPGSDVDAVLVTALARTNDEALFNLIVKRPASARALLAAMKDGRVQAASLGPGNVARLRTHPDPEVAREAAARAGRPTPGAREKSEIIADLLPVVERAGDPKRGELLFTGACGSCHRLGGVGQSEVGPPLTGMGAHGRAELLAQIIDPNREVDPSFWQWNVTTKAGETLAGVIGSMNDGGITLRTPGGDVALKNAQIADRENTRRSLMPEGLEALGPDALRDILAFMTAHAEPAAGESASSAQGPKEGGPNDAPLPPTTPVSWAAGKTKVLIVGGGSAHEFGKFFGDVDGATLTAAGFSVHYTEDRDQAAAEIANADVAVISVNRQHFDTPAWRKALFDFAAAGKGIIMLHPGTWYGFPAWPELNASIVGGGARGHDPVGKFSIKVLEPEHPVMKGVPASFDVQDELYYMNAESANTTAGTASIDVLAETSPSVKFKRPHPAVWVTRHPTARIVGITLGHDQRVHEHEAFKTLLANAVRWAAGSTR